jgi:hypothetical protein
MAIPTPNRGPRRGMCSASVPGPGMGPGPPEKMELVMFGRLLIVAPLAATVLWAAPATAQERVRHPGLHAALAELREARKEIRDAGDNWPPGRKEQALTAIDDATRSIKVVLGVKGDDFRGLDRNPDYYTQYKDHPRLRSALHDLREARRELEDAKADFGLYREQAIGDLDVACGSIVLLMRK